MSDESSAPVRPPRKLGARPYLLGALVLFVFPGLVGGAVWWLVAQKRAVDRAFTEPILELKGHEGLVYSVAISPDGCWALSGSNDNTLRLWDLETGAMVRKLEGHTGKVFSVAILPDGKCALSGSVDHTIRLWDLGTDREVRKFAVQRISNLSIAFSPDGRRGLFGDPGGTLHLWDVETGKKLWESKEPEGPEVRRRRSAPSIRSIAVSPAGRRALSGSGDGPLRLWDLGTGETIRVFTGHADPVFSVAISADGRRALSGSADQTLRLWDLGTGETILVFTGHADIVSSVAFGPNGRRALSGSWDSTLRLWDVETGQEICRFMRTEPTRMYSVAFAPDGRRILSGGWTVIAEEQYEPVLLLWRVPTDQELKVWRLMGGKFPEP